MHFLPHSQGERLLASALLAVALHLAGYLLLDGLPPARQGQVGLTVRLQAAPEVAQAATPAAPTAAAVAAPVAVSPLAANPEMASDVVPARALAQARYYTASELDKLAEPLQPIVLPELEDALPPDTVLDVYIDYQGVVQRVVLPGGLDEHFASQVKQRFLAAQFAPAEKNGVAVNSLKRIVLQAEDL
ncbi:hypothetical protein [Vogesella sp. XCS3]|uniref:hypothetical protein n=1 Tax=Vogesella sp. XCS3 TaxID=2877939 RepID=UPI001D0B6802|nr:hypothetical protein [Vogesella sp. XCS3]UDM17436.1 hypothetical protein LCH97_01820 [Vogesella sp. XCS3]